MYLLYHVRCCCTPVAETPLTVIDAVLERRPHQNTRQNSITILFHCTIREETPLFLGLPAESSRKQTGFSGKLLSVVERSLFLCLLERSPSVSSLVCLPASLCAFRLEKGTAATAWASSHQIPPAPSPVCSVYLQTTSPAFSPLPMTVFSSNGRHCYGGVKQALLLYGGCFFFL